VGISGGIDSLVLLFLLDLYNETYAQKWDIKAVHIDAGFPDWNPEPMIESLNARNIHPIILRTDAYKKIKEVQNKCFLCAKDRREKLMDTARELGIFNIALAHHKEDVAETLLLNMLYSGRMATFLPRQTVFHGRSFFIRPLYYLDKDAILEIAKAFGLESFGNSCPFYKNSRRERIREILNTMKKENPDIHANIFHSIFNIKQKYIPS
jgi:tRNA 2-thiocytidine biosynthesis protein TtcA